MNIAKDVVTDVTAVVQPSLDVTDHGDGVPERGDDLAGSTVTTEQGREGPAQQPPVVTLEIRQDFRELISPLLPEELEALEVDVCQRGCLDPLKVWADRNIVLDGHNRYEICQKHGISFSVILIDLPDEPAAKTWILDHQAHHNQADDQRALSAAVRLKIVSKATLRARGKKARAAVKARHPVQPEQASDLSAAASDTSRTKPKLDNRVEVAHWYRVAERKVRQATLLLDDPKARNLVTKVRNRELTLADALKALRKRQGQAAASPKNLPAEKTLARQDGLDLILSPTPALFQAMRQGLNRLVDDSVVGELQANPDAVQEAKSLVIALQDAARKLDEAINAVTQQKAAQAGRVNADQLQEQKAAAAG